MMRKTTVLAATALFSAAAFAAPKLQSLAVKPNPAHFSGDKPPEVEIVVAVSRGKFEKGGCDARLDFGDGERRTLDFGVAATRTVHHAYSKGGSYTIAVSGTGATPCEGSQQAALKVTEAPKKAEPKKKAPARKTSKKKDDTK
jgi:hypothetical protein